MLPLSGVRVIAVEQYGAGPYGTSHLADLGAEVIKIENAKTGGDMSRGVGPHFLAEGDSEFFQSLNRNKRSLTLDLKHADGQRILHKLAATADGLLGNLRGDQPAKLGLTYAHLKAHNRKIVCAHLSAYGREGPRAAWPGYDYLLQAEAGFLHLTGEPDNAPARFGLSVVDYMTGTMAAFALLSGVIAARATGEGRDLDVSLFDVAMHQLNYVGAWYLNEGQETGRAPRSAHPYIVPSQLYRTADGWIFIMCQKHEQWRSLCLALDRADLADNPDYAGYEGRFRDRDRLTEELDRALMQHTTAEWLERLEGVVPRGPVNTMAQALDNPFFRERGGVQELAHPDRPDFKLIESPVRLNEPTAARPGPKLGADTEDLLRELGYSGEEIDALRDSQVV